MERGPGFDSATVSQLGDVSPQKSQLPGHAQTRDDGVRLQGSGVPERGMRTNIEKQKHEGTPAPLPGKKVQKLYLPELRLSRNRNPEGNRSARIEVRDS